MTIHTLYIYKLICARNLQEWTTPAYNIKEALANFSKNNGLQLENCDELTGYWIEKSTFGWWKTLEIFNIRRRH